MGQENIFECYGYAYEDQSKDELSKFLEEDKYEYDTIDVYFHGELQSLIGYDIPLFRIAPGVKRETTRIGSTKDWMTEKQKRHPNIPLGRNEIIVHVFGHKEPIKAIAYIWDGKLSCHFKRGYIVLENDKDSNDFAAEQMKNKAEII